MMKNKKLFYGILIIILVTGGWLIWSNQSETTCTQDAALDFFYTGQGKDPCDRLCNFDNDCKLECGCECISKNEKCIYSGVECEMPNPNYDCKCINNICKYKYIGIEQVTIITDKTEYEQGETVKITVKNNLDKSIFYYLPYFCDDSSLSAEGLLDKWYSVLFGEPKCKADEEKKLNPNSEVLIEIDSMKFEKPSGPSPYISIVV